MMNGFNHAEGMIYGDQRSLHYTAGGLAVLKSSMGPGQSLIVG